ncbi:MAG TPA: WYL domain-containing protein, partial [Candidatus Mediterraneibacter colneyensis]|nr:WYL domain-containing protein [Candidatus Mediterraneibacter colneyensis]
DDTMKIFVKCNEAAMRYWALQYGPYVEVLEPERLREQVKKDVNSMAEKYNIQK